MSVHMGRGCRSLSQGPPEQRPLGQRPSIAQRPSIGQRPQKKRPPKQRPSWQRSHLIAANVSGGMHPTASHCSKTYYFFKVLMSQIREEESLKCERMCIFEHWKLKSFQGLAVSISFHSNYLASLCWKLSASETTKILDPHLKHHFLYFVTRAW